MSERAAIDGARASEPATPSTDPDTWTSLTSITGQNASPASDARTSASLNTTAPRRLYLIRHAESALNAQRMHQVHTVGLSPRGCVQAQALARRLASLEVDLVLSSTYARAAQTASYVTDALNRPMLSSPLLVEVKRPSVIEGRAYDDPEVVAIKEALARKYGSEGWRHSDEETFADVTARARACLHFVQGQDARAIVAITHGYFITVLSALMLYRGALQPQDVLRLQERTRHANTGITHWAHTPDQGWILVTWNDHVHLDSLTE